MNMENQEIKNSDSGDEISLIDLLVVLLKFRKMIIGITAAAFCIAIAGYFVYPVLLQYRLQGKAETPISELQTVIMVVGLVPAADSFLSKNQFGFYFRRPDIIITALEESGVISSPEDRKDWSLPLSGTWDTKENIYKSPNEKLQVKENPEAATIEFYYKTRDSARGILFLNSLFILGSEAVEAHINSLGKAYLNSFEALLQKQGVSGYEDILIRENQDKYFFSQGIVSGSIKASVMLVEPYAEPLRSQAYYKRAYKTGAIVAVLAAFFLSIFFAFLRNAIAGIRENGEAMEKIRSAFRKIDKRRQ
jgi:uncharacterized protein involved in exopolysaccharide biosynthesis